MSLLFIPQSWADRALMEDHIEIQTSHLSIPAEGRKYALQEAVRVVSVEGGSSDPAGVVGKVLTKAEIRARGGEVMEDSLILEDTAYRVQPGFLAEYLGEGNPISPSFHHEPGHEE